MLPFLLIALLLLAGGFCGWIYFKREFAVKRRGLLLGARLVAVAGVVALLWNPVMPAGGPGAGPERYLILDASVSMAALTPAGTPVWEAAVERAAELAAGGARLLVARDGVHALDPAALDSLQPAGTGSVFAEAVTVAAEAGAREVVLLTDRRLRDPVATAAVARRLAVSLTADTLPGAAANLGIGRLDVPAAIERGETLRGRLEIEGATGDDSVTVTVSLDGTPAQALRLAAPAPGGTSVAEFTLGAGLDPGPHRVTARIEGTDALPDDDERAAIVQADPEETGVLLVAFAPDWEPRFLLPVLKQVTGLPVRGYLATGPDRYQAMEPGAAGVPGVIDRGAMERLLRRAEMVVAMGIDGDAAAFLAGPAARTQRLLLFAADGAGAAAGGVEAGDGLPGEWYLEEAPPSPIAGEVAGFGAAGLPPLTRVLPVLDGGGGPALDVRLGGAGQPQAALVLRTEQRRRIGVVLARGFWRWAFRDGAPREHYRRLWAAVGGWMMADEPLAAGPGVRPGAPVLPRGAPLFWLGRGYEGEEVALTVTDSAGAIVLDSTLTVPPGGSFTTPPLPPARYGYAVAPADTTAPADTAAPADTTAPAAPPTPFEVDSFTDDMLRLPVPPAELSVRAPAESAASRGSRPLRTWPALYLVILAALCAEWIGRRRSGLR